MLINRLFNLIVAAVLVVMVALAVQQAFATQASTPNAKYSESQEQALREYRLGERYGEMPALIAKFSAEQIRREYFLGERYGVTLRGYTAQQALREYWLGERYGQTP